MSPFFNAERNLEEFEAIHGFRPSDVQWVPRRSVEDRRDNRDPKLIFQRMLILEQPIPGYKPLTVLERADAATRELA